MNAKLAIVIIAVGLAAAATRVAAHHSFAAEFDANRTVTLTGTVTRIEWTNPHSHIFVDVKDGQGIATTWRLELASPRVLVQLGWRARTVNVGDQLTVEGWMAKDGSTTANASVITFADGRRVSAGSSGGDRPLR
jgi:hypothetical protein